MSSVFYGPLFHTTSFIYVFAPQYPILWFYALYTIRPSFLLGFDAPDDEKVLLGSWGRAESYAKNIIEDVNHWVTGWLDWNLALDTTGGPNWAANRVDAPIIVNATADEFYKQPMFYALGHFSKFVPGGSVHVGSRVVKGDGVSDGDDSNGGDDGDGELHSAAFIHADGGCVLILLNT
ncbi:putative glucosylceramidase 3 [Penaeus japonicus]|uniref:putative glucosylceramidase 3 n=1 Tax=Penaeus japonicus TaxID=27405 RepID=UPI001C714075|nr:putative glucosylceramidase 3 [Penaeus japonicus]